tara:strand:+ start:142 stop:753 length:612 start_codon:yes stop_codon:yes gene_type:complete
MKDTIMVTHNVFTKEECEEIIDNVPTAVEKYSNIDFNKDVFDQGPHSSERQDSQYHGPLILNTIPYKDEYYSEKLKGCLIEAINIYGMQFPIIKEIHIDRLGIYFNGFKVQRTKVGEGFHKWHYEDLERRNRFLVWSLFLNDVKEGGETEFLYKNTRVPAKQGSLCLFPSDWTHLHRGNPPISNEKWIMTGWYEYDYINASSK